MFAQFAARLKLPGTVRAAERREKVQQLVRDFRLQHCLHTRE